MIHKKETISVQHPIAPIYDTASEILILGSFPSVRSREAGFFYAHPQNRFWRVLASIYAETVPEETEEKKRFLYRHHIALWDVIASCTMEGSADASIRNVRPNDLSCILHAAPISRICVNGQTAMKYYNRYIRAHIGREAEMLPSTSAANASWSLARLTDVWKKCLTEGEKPIPEPIGMRHGR